MNARPSFQFYARDWLTCPELRRCSVAARGLWADLLALAHFGEPYGHLASKGRPYDVAELARLTGCGKAEVARLLAELERNGVFSRAEDGAILSRRMVRDGAFVARRAEIGAEHGHKGAEFGIRGSAHGSKGGRPRTKTGGEDDEKTPGQNPPSKPLVEPGQNPPPASASASASASPSPSAQESLPTLRRGKTPAPVPIDPATVALPASLDRPDVRAELAAWVARRCEEKHPPLGPVGLARVVNQLVTRGPDFAVHALGMATDRGWRGLSVAWVDREDAEAAGLRPAGRGPSRPPHGSNLFADELARRNGSSAPTIEVPGVRVGGAV